jgi:hypothetical protein
VKVAPRGIRTREVLVCSGGLTDHESEVDQQPSSGGLVVTNHTNLGSSRAFALLVPIVFLATAFTSAQDLDGDRREPPPFDQFLVVPLRIHVLSSSELSEADCKLSETDVARILGKVNGVWNKAGIHFGLESLVFERAVVHEKFVAEKEKAAQAVPLPAFRWLMPDESRERELLHVYYIHDFSVNGVYLGDGTAVVKETARLRPVEGGIDEPLPRVTSHELGHALGLPHREQRTNLMASGTTGTLLNESEARRARARAARMNGVYRVGDLERQLDALEKTKNHDRAQRLRSWLEGIPRSEAGKG